MRRQNTVITHQRVLLI